MPAPTTSDRSRHRHDCKSSDVDRLLAGSGLAIPEVLGGGGQRSEVKVQTEKDQRSKVIILLSSERKASSTACFVTATTAYNIYMRSPTVI